MIKNQYIQNHQRLYGIKNPIIAITGGIATGKSTVCDILREKELPVISADEQIKIIYQEEKTIRLIQNIAPKTIKNGKIDFKSLRKTFFENEDIKKQIEDYLYPVLAIRISEFAQSQPSHQEIYYEIPLLFEKELQDNVDIAIVVYAPEHIQLQRLLKRDASSPEVAKMIIKSQINIEEKKRSATFIIENLDSHSREDLKIQIETILNTIRK